MKCAIIQEHSTELPVSRLCDAFEVSRSGYYEWCQRAESSRAKANQGLREQIRVVFTESRETYGSPRVTKALRDNGHLVNEKRVARLMRQEELRSVHRRKFKPQMTDSNHSERIAPNRLQQDFSTTRLNQKWCGDITYIPTSEGWLYLATVMDIHSRRIIGWATSRTPDASLAAKAFRMAVMLRRGKPSELIYHSDRGVQYASSAFRSLLTEYKVTPSMSRCGNCYDNAVAESFFHTLKVEEVHRHTYPSRAAAHRAIADYIERFYNASRFHSALGYRAPNIFEESLKAA